MTKKARILKLFNASSGLLTRKEIAKITGFPLQTVKSVFVKLGLKNSDRLADFYRNSDNHIIIKVDKRSVVLRKTW